MSSSALEDVLYGALARGVNATTLLLVNAVFVALCLSLLGLLWLCWDEAPSAVPHVAFLLVLFVGLAVSSNWVILQIGLVDSKKQRQELHLDEPDSGAETHGHKKES
mmetsp:Transcript_37314/g.105286  ORF Transcript_37314/g.105286 Transcript_37314/m.105286 type:complete len:107 (+) Transcript_37314:126-446(+)